MAASEASGPQTGRSWDPAKRVGDGIADAGVNNESSERPADAAQAIDKPAQQHA